MAEMHPQAVELGQPYSKLSCSRMHPDRCLVQAVGADRVSGGFRRAALHATHGLKSLT